MWMAYELNAFDGTSVAIFWETAYEIRPASCREVAKAGYETHVSLWGPDNQHIEVPAFNTQSRGSDNWCFPKAERAGLSLDDANYQDYKPTPPCAEGFIERRISFHAYLEKGEGEEIVIGDYTWAQYEADYAAMAMRNSSSSEGSAGSSSTSYCGGPTMYSCVEDVPILLLP